ncbi:MAG TPA: hypothetical protein VGS10_17950 [Terracidiphilus sp.]|nr:hypothetical protein [Terracidiphilus sp.]
MTRHAHLILGQVEQMRGELQGPHCLSLMRRMWLMLLSICTVTWAAAGLLTRSGEIHADALLGGALILYSMIGIAKVQISVSKRVEVWLSPIVGALTGL